MTTSSPYNEEQIRSENLSELMYDYDQYGNYTSRSGNYYMKHEEILMHDMLKMMKEKLDGIREQVRAGKLSPLAFHMENKHMDPGILARYAEISARKVKRHLKSGNFSELPAELLKKYADAFEIPVEELVTLPE
ncbi:MAG TPA: helix-turn-helix transcriptional regulator [Bacteroidales bacterium]|nr:helix-turn-helix transcriptional regulator [Bacteroidales bacterium]